MLTFHSASARIVDSRRAIADCLEAACGDRRADIDLLIIHAAVGHDFHVLAQEAAALAPRARIVGASCCGVVGTEGVSESLKDIAIMAVRGPELAVAQVDGIHGHNSAERANAMAADLKRQLPHVNMVFFMASSIDIDNDACISGIESKKPTTCAALNDSPALVGRPCTSSIITMMPPGLWLHHASYTTEGSRVTPPNQGPSAPVCGLRRW